MITNTDGHLWNEDSWHHPWATALLYDISMQHLMNFRVCNNQELCMVAHGLDCLWLEYDDKLMWSDLVFTQTNVGIS